MISSLFKFTVSVAMALMLSTGIGFAASVLAPNQTEGFGKSNILKFSYLQNFVCVNQSKDDRNYNGIKAELDTSEIQAPICQIGASSQISPSGAPVRKSRPLYTIIPFFSLSANQNPNDAFSPALGQTLINLFGFLPEAFKINPLVSVQCPTPGTAAGTCTMHAPTVDVFPTLAAQGKVPPSPAMNILIPSPNHDHIIDDEVTETGPIWWQIISVSIFDPSDWPALDGSSGITSVKQLKEAEQLGRAIETPTNIFLYFSSKELHHH